MPWRKIRQYSGIWNQASNRFTIDLWLTPPNTQNLNQVDYSFRNLEAAEFTAILAMLRGDRDGQLFCDTMANQISTGVDPL